MNSSPLSAHIASSTRSVHTVRYNRKQPDIVKVDWHN